MDKETFEKDLTSWNLMSIAGRLQKPYRAIESNYSGQDRADFDASIRKNRELALNFSAMNLEQDLENVQVDRNVLREIVGLSYAGDIRMKVKAESGDKIDKILDGNFDEIH